MDEKDLRMYDIVSARRIHHDAHVWQVPVLSLTAQAFLFTISLAHDSSIAARIMSASLSVSISVMSIHLMVRHRAFERTDALWIEAFEAQHGLDAQTAIRASPVGPRTFRFLVRWTAFDVWVWGLALFGLAALLVITFAALKPEILT